MRLDPRPAPGFQGVWYGNQPTAPPYYWKYSGGLATYPQQHAPIAVYRGDARRTYFVYGGAGDRPAGAAYRPRGREAPGTTSCCVSYFDHDRGALARPIELLARDVIDAHENPVLCVDPVGRLLVFCPAHGPSRPSYVLRSERPHDLDSFQLVREFLPGDNFSYPQPWWVDGQGVVLLHTAYEGDRRRLAVARSADGVDWSDWGRRRFVSRLGEGSYQVSWAGAGGVIATAFDVHPRVEGDAPLNRRTNLYYAQTRDGGATWTDPAGGPLDMPVADVGHPARVLDVAGERALVYLKDVCFDAAGRPVVLYLTSASAWPGPGGGPRRWWVARADGGGWSHRVITESDHNYDHGSLLILPDDDWRLIAPTDAGPRRFATGGAMRCWRSRDRGETWGRGAILVDDPERSHTYARRPLDVDAGFAMLWAAADAERPSASTLFFCDADGRSFRMPFEVDADFVEPEPAE